MEIKRYISYCEANVKAILKCHRQGESGVSIIAFNPLQRWPYIREEGGAQSAWPASDPPTLTSCSDHAAASQ